MNQNKPSFYGIIPADVRYDKELSDFQKLLYVEITALTEKEGYCWASNKYFAELYGKSEHWISAQINVLKSKGKILIEIDKEKGNERKIYLYQNSGIPIPEKKDTYTTKIVEDTIYNNIPNTIINNVTKVTRDNDFVKTIPIKKEYGKPEINEIMSYLKLKFNLPYIAREKKDRYEAERLLKVKEIDGNVEKVKVLIDVFANDNFWCDKITSCASLYKHAPTMFAKMQNRKSVIVNIDEQIKEQNGQQ